MDRFGVVSGMRVFLPLNAFAPGRNVAKHFYEKVVKVKADVAAILKFFSRSIPQIEPDHLDVAPLAPIGGMRKGGSSPSFNNIVSQRCSPYWRWRWRGGRRPSILFPRGCDGEHPLYGGLFCGALSCNWLRTAGFGSRHCRCAQSHGHQRQHCGAVVLVASSAMLLEIAGEVLVWWLSE